jgi:hypothetical protein
MAKSGLIQDFKTWVFKPFRKEGKNVWRVFVLCFFTAALFWFFNSLNKTYTTEISFPLQVVYDDANYIPVNDLPGTARIEVSGFGWDLLKWSLGYGLEPMLIDPGNYELSAISLKDYRNEFTEKLGQVKLNKFMSDSLRLDFDRKISRRLLVALDTGAINFESGYRLRDSIIIVPDSLTLSGPQSILDNLRDRFVIEPGNRKISRTFDDEISIDFKSNPLVNLNRNSVNVYFEVEKVVGKELNLDIVKLNFPDDTIGILPSSVILDVRAAEWRLEESELDSIRAVADYQLMNPSDSSIPISLANLPEYFENPVLNIDSVKISK